MEIPIVLMWTLIGTLVCVWCDLCWEVDLGFGGCTAASLVPYEAVPVVATNNAKRC